MNTLFGGKRWIGLALWMMTWGLAVPAQAMDAEQSARERINFDAGWRFALGHATDSKKDFDFASVPFFFAKAGYGDGPASPKFDDRAWRVLNLPHDWDVELPFDARGDGNHGSKAIGRHFPENSAGWYRKSFPVSRQDEGRRIVLDLDGVYRDAQVWVNGFYLGTEPSGYSSAHYDMTDYLNYGGSNVVAIRVDATIEEGWFYEGAGIYRHVWLTKTAPVHVATDGVFVTTAVEDATAEHPRAKVDAVVTVANDTHEDADYQVDLAVEDAGGGVVGRMTKIEGNAAAKASGESTGWIGVTDAKLWSLDSPTLYKLVTTVTRDGKVVDRVETPFGIRTIRWDADQGFFLNGKHVEIAGTNDHQDHAGLGVALPDDANTYRVARLKATGSNAIRTSHNEPTAEFLDACDRLGMLVLDENRMMGTTEEDLDHFKRQIERDRNHPSVILWSVGNEEWALEWSVFGERLTREMQAFGKRLDPTRPFTVALSGSGAGNSLSTEVMGYNYYLQHRIDEMHKRFPLRPSVGTEESSSEHTRGVYADDRDRQHLVAYDFEADGQHASLEEAWNYHRSRPFSAGLFYWTGFDYRGETTPFDWPAISSQFGILDTCGFFKDNAYLVQSWWTKQPMVHVLPHWNWVGKLGKPGEPANAPIDVRVYSNTAAVELALNGRSLGRKPVVANSHLEWKVPFAPGKLVATGYDAVGKVLATDTVETTGAPAGVELMAGPPETPGDGGVGGTQMSADGASVRLVTVRVKDAAGRAVPDADNRIQFALTGPGKIIGVGNGDPASHEPDKFVERVESLPVAEWRTQATDARQSGPETAADFDDTKWERARDPRWDEKRVDPPASVFRGVFTLPAGTQGAAVKLLLRSIGDEQSVYLNGHALGLGLKFDAEGFAYPLRADWLKTGRNVVTVYATRLSAANKKLQAFHWDGPGPAAAQVITPAAPWRRSLFNGLAQVIVQAGTEPGVMELTATSPGLKAGTLEIRTIAGSVR